MEYMLHIGNPAYSGWPPFARVDLPVRTRVAGCDDRPVTDLALLDGRIFGFCNAFRRDKPLADPLARPAFAAMLGREMCAGSRVCPASLTIPKLRPA